MQVLDAAFWKQAFLDIADAVEARKDYLCELDGAVGDGDHGVSMTMGFREVATRLREQPASDIGGALKTVGSTFIATVGGVTGIVFGTFFATAGKGVEGQTEVGTQGLAAMFRSGLDTVKAKAKVSEGDKSMVDALSPAVSALESAATDGLSPAEALKKAAASAAQGMESTREMVAKVGRARYQGEKAIGHIDAGAASVALIFETLSATAGQSCQTS